MQFRTSLYEDWPAIKDLHLAVSKQKTGIARWEHEITDDYVQSFVRKSTEHGIMIVALHPEDPTRIVAEIHAVKSKLHVFSHLMTDLTIAVHPDFQGKKLGRTLFTIFLEEIAVNHHDIGKVELVTRESNTRAIQLYQSLGFLIEGRMEMRIRTPQGNFEADIAMGWINPNFEYDSADQP
jgi:ribosomal protein S18 acetylase RimI-like enzyme